MVNDKETDFSQRQGTMRSLSMSILPLARKIVGKRGMVLADLLVAWEKIVGKQLAAYTCPEKLDFIEKDKDRAVLRLKVLSGAVALEVQHNKKAIMEKINTYFGRDMIAEIKIMQDGVWLLSGNDKNNQPQSQKNLVSEDEQNYIDELSEGIDNLTLREKLAELGKSVFSNNK